MLPGKHWIVTQGERMPSVRGFQKFVHAEEVSCVIEFFIQEPSWLPTISRFLPFSRCRISSALVLRKNISPRIYTVSPPVTRAFQFRIMTSSISAAEEKGRSQKRITLLCPKCVSAVKKIMLHHLLMRLLWQSIKKLCIPKNTELFGSGRRIRTLTYGVRVRCATFTQSRCVPDEQILLYASDRICQQFFCVFLKNFFPLTGPAARDGRRSRKGGQNQAAMRSAPVKYFFSGRYSSANTTAQRMMSGSM